MPQFMLLLTENEVEERRLTPAQIKALVEGHSDYERKLRALSAFVDGGRLRPSSEGRRISTRAAQARVDSGPFGDKALSVYYVVEADGLPAALELAQQCPLSPGAE